MHTFASTFAQPLDPSNHRAQSGDLAGLVFDMGPYPVNAARSLFGVEPTDVVWAVGTRHPTPLAYFPMETPAQKCKILFLCTWNTSRSTFAEYYFMKDLASERFERFSAGVTPIGKVSLVTLRILQEKFRIDASGARKKVLEVAHLRSPSNPRIRDTEETTS